MINCKLVATDFDGTLLSTDKKISFENLKSLEKCKEKGIFVVGVTARTSSSVFSVVDKKLFDYFILNNGTHLYDVKKGVLITFSSIFKFNYSKIFEEMKDFCKEIDFCSGNYYFVYGNDLVKKSFIKNIHSLDDINEDIGRMNLFLLEQEKLEYYCDFINKKYMDINCFIMQDSDDDYKWLVIMPKEVSKFSTLVELGITINVKCEDMVFFGDGPNDIEVISGVGYGVAMENAVDDVKKSSKYVTLTNDDNGVSAFLEREVL